MKNADLVTVRFEWNAEILVLVVLLIGVIALGVILVLWVKSWQRGMNEVAPDSPQSLEDYRKLLDQGLLLPEEFEKIRVQLEPPSIPVAPPTSENKPAPPDPIS